MTLALTSSSRAASSILTHPAVCASNKIARALSPCHHHHHHQLYNEVLLRSSSPVCFDSRRPYATARAPVTKKFVPKNAKGATKPIRNSGKIAVKPNPLPQKPHTPSLLSPYTIYVTNESINPPLSTLPPPLDLPEKDDDTPKPVYWFRTGRAYGKFYYAGVKATYANYKRAKVLRKSIRKFNASGSDLSKTSSEEDEKNATSVAEGETSMAEMSNYPPRRFFGLLPPPLLLDIEVYIRSQNQRFTRSQLQLLTRERQDVKKLPLFAVMFALFGEWLPLIVPFIPGRVPRTCRIPKQVIGMRKALEERRKVSFRRGVQGPEQQDVGRGFEMVKTRVDRCREIEAELEAESKEAERTLVPVDDLAKELDAQEAADVMALRVQPANWLAVNTTEALSRQQIVHVSTTLGLHGKIWERLGLVGGDSSSLMAVLLKMRVAKHLHYLALDDELLTQDSANGAHGLSSDELHIACEERGIDVTGRREEELRKDLERWLEGRANDKGYGGEVMKMLFKRPNVW